MLVGGLFVLYVSSVVSSDRSDNGMVAVVEGQAGRVVEPVLDRAAVENARLVNELRAELLRSGTALTVEAIASGGGGRRADTVRRWVLRRRDAHQLVAVTHEGQLLVPSFQLTPALDDVDEVAAAVVARLVDHGLDAWAVWDWFLTADPWLGGGRPVDALAGGQAEALGRAVAGLLQE